MKSSRGHLLSSFSFYQLLQLSLFQLWPSPLSFLPFLAFSWPAFLLLYGILLLPFSSIPLPFLSSPVLFLVFVSLSHVQLGFYFFHYSHTFTANLSFISLLCHWNRYKWNVQQV